MGIFSQTVKNSYEGYDSEITENKSFEEAVLNDDSLDTVFSESMDLTECGLQAVIDINENYNMIEKALMGNELVYMEQTGKEYEYTEVVVEGFIESIKNFLKKVWEKIKALFKRFIMKIDSYMKNDKEFVQKYKKEIYSGKDLSDFTFKGYKFTLDNLTNAIKKCGISESNFKTFEGIEKNAGDSKAGQFYDANNDNFKKDNEKFTDEAEKERGEVAVAAGAKSGGSMDATEFRKALFEAFRNGESEKEELDKINLSDYATELMTSKQTKKELNDAYKASDRTIKDTEKVLNSIIKGGHHELPVKPSGDTQQAKDNDKEKSKHYEARVTGANYYLKWTHLSAELLTAVNAEGLRAINDRSRQYKACIVAAVAHKSKSESAYEESYTPTGGSGFLADLALK